MGIGIGLEIGGGRMDSSEGYYGEERGVIIMVVLLSLLFLRLGLGGNNLFLG